MSKILDRRTDPYPGQDELNNTEHIDLHGNLKIPVYNWIDNPPKRKGWKVFWVNVNLKRNPIKIYSYKRI